MQTSDRGGKDAARRLAHLSAERKRAAEKPLPKIENGFDLQITGGKFQGRQLHNTASPKILPTPERIRASLFEVLGERITLARFLDLGAGAGGVGIEAISRGAMLGTFVERSAKMCSLIKANLDALGVPAPGRGEIVNLESEPFLIRMRRRARRWDVVYCAPPEGNHAAVIELFARGCALKVDGGILVVEHAATISFPANIGVLTLSKIIKHDDTALTFFSR